MLGIPCPHDFGVIEGAAGCELPDFEAGMLDNCMQRRICVSRHAFLHVKQQLVMHAHMQAHLSLAHMHIVAM